MEAVEVGGKNSSEVLIGAKNGQQRTLAEQCPVLHPDELR